MPTGRAGHDGHSRGHCFDDGESKWLSRRLAKEMAALSNSADTLAVHESNSTPATPADSTHDSRTPRSEPSPTTRSDHPSEARFDSSTRVTP